MRVTYSFIGLNVLIYLLTYHNIFINDINYLNYIMLYFGLNKLFFEGFYWQVLSSMFLHGSILHLVMNMVVLFQLGNILESFLGGKRFFIYYIFGGILTSIFSLIFIFYSSKFINVIGASGAVCVMFGVFVALVKDKESKKGVIISILAMSFLPLLAGINIAWQSHIIGLIVGYLMVKIEYFYKMSRR